MRRSQKVATLFAASAFGVFGMKTSLATTIASWNFESNAIAVNNSPAPSAGSGTLTSLGMTNSYPTPTTPSTTTDDVLLGKTTDTGANAVADVTNAWRIRGGNGTAGGTPNGWSSLAPIGTQGLQAAASTVGYTGPINISFDWYSTTQGEANLELAYTDDGTTWTNLPITLGGSDVGLQVLTNSASSNTVNGSYVSDNKLTGATNAGGGALAGQDWFTGLTASINDPLAINNPLFAIEIVNASTGVDNVSTQGTALNNSSGNWRFDNVSVSGTAVPEPASVSLLGLGAIALLTSRRRGKTA